MTTIFYQRQMPPTLRCYIFASAARAEKTALRRRSVDGTKLNKKKRRKKGNMEIKIEGQWVKVNGSEIQQKGAAHNDLCTSRVQLQN